jgi:hypothetical protein
VAPHYADRRFNPPTQVALADILKNIVSNFWPLKIGCNLVKGLLGAQVTCQWSVMEVLEQHGPE